jgi:hypothetical protein
MFEAGSEKPEHGHLDNQPEAVDAWGAMLYARFQGRPVAVCLEQSRGSLVYLLAKYAHLRLFPVHPKTAAQSGRRSVLPAPRVTPEIRLRYWICC